MNKDCGKIVSGEVAGVCTLSGRGLHRPKNLSYKDILEYARVFRKKICCFGKKLYLCVLIRRILNYHYGQNTTGVCVSRSTFNADRNIFRSLTQKAAKIFAILVYFVKHTQPEQPARPLCWKRRKDTENISFSAKTIYILTSPALYCLSGLFCVCVSQV
jgi:hypothetical protein